MKRIQDDFDDVEAVLETHHEEIEDIRNAVSEHAEDIVENANHIQDLYERDVELKEMFGDLGVSDDRAVATSPVLYIDEDLTGNEIDDLQISDDDLNDYIDELDSRGLELGQDIGIGEAMKTFYQDRADRRGYNFDNNSFVNPFNANQPQPSPNPDSGDEGISRRGLLAALGIGGAGLIGYLVGNENDSGNQDTNGRPTAPESNIPIGSDFTYDEIDGYLSSGQENVIEDDLIHERDYDSLDELRWGIMQNGDEYSIEAYEDDEIVYSLPGENLKGGGE